jgi:hypothetical protein
VIREIAGEKHSQPHLKEEPVPHASDISSSTVTNPFDQKEASVTQTYSPARAIAATVTIMAYGIEKMPQ